MQWPQGREGFSCVLPGLGLAFLWLHHQEAAPLPAQMKPKNCNNLALHTFFFSFLSFFFFKFLSLGKSRTWGEGWGLVTSQKQKGAARALQPRLRARGTQADSEEEEEGMP